LPYVIAVNSFALVNYLFGKECVLQIFLVTQSLERRIGHFDFYAFVHLIVFIYGLFPSPFGIAGPILSVVSVVCCQRSLLWDDHLSREVLSNVVFVTECDRKVSKIRGLCSTRGCCVKKNIYYLTMLCVFERVPCMIDN